MYVKKCQALKRCTQKKIGRCWRCNERKVRGERVCSEYLWAWCGDCGVLAVDMTSSLCQTFHGKLSFWTSIITRNLLRLVRSVESGKIKINCRLRWQWKDRLIHVAVSRRLAPPTNISFVGEREREIYLPSASQNKRLTIKIVQWQAAIRKRR